MHGKVGLVGGAFDPDKEGQAFVDLEQDDTDTHGIVRASSMLEVLCWDPCGTVKAPLSVASLPLESALGGAGSQRSGWIMLEIIGQILESSGKVVKGITFDAHGSHQIIRKVLHGQFQDISEESIKNTPFFKELVFIPLPKNDLPRLPIQVCLHQKEPFYGQTGPCSLSPVKGFLLAQGLHFVEHLMVVFIL